MPGKIQAVLLLFLLLAGCTKEPLNECTNEGCVILNGRLWDNLNNRGASFVRLQFRDARDTWWRNDDLYKFQTDSFGYFHYRIPKKYINKFPENLFALRCIDDGYVLTKFKYIDHDFIQFKVEDNRENEFYTIQDTVQPVGLIDFHFLPSSTRQIIQFNYNLNNYWRMGPLLIDINQSPYTTYRLPVPLRDNQPIWVSYHGTVNNVPFGDSSYIELKHRQHIQIAPLQP